MLFQGFVQEQASCSAGNISRMTVEMDTYGRGWLTAAAHNTLSADVTYLLGIGTLGWTAQVMATTTTNWALLGIAEQDMASAPTTGTASVARFNILGYNPSCSGHASNSATTMMKMYWSGATSSWTIVATAGAFGTGTYGLIPCAVSGTSSPGVILFGNVTNCSSC